MWTFMDNVKFHIKLIKGENTIKFIYLFLFIWIEVFEFL